MRTGWYNGTRLMRLLACACAPIVLWLSAAPAIAQDAPPPIPRFAVDARGTIPKFTRNLRLAQSRGLDVTELPGSGFGFDLDGHVYVFTWKAVTIGLGGQLTVARSHRSERVAGGEVVGRAVTERLTSISPQISFNFGTGDGWSYISGGIGPATWSVVPDAGSSLSSDTERLQTINYGGGARWFAKPHVAFTFDVRFYAINPGTPVLGLPGSPRTTMLIFGAGVSVK